VIEPGQPIFWVPHDEPAAMSAVIIVAMANKRRREDFMVFSWLVNALFVNVYFNVKVRLFVALQIYEK